MAIPIHEENGPRKRWMADSGCAKVICTDTRDMISFQEVDPNDPEYRYETANGEYAQATGIGRAVIKLDLGNGRSNSLEVDCIYRPGVSCNLFNIEAAKNLYGIYSHRYALLIIDDYSRCIFVRFLKNKSDAPTALIEFTQGLNNITGKWPARWRMDNTPDFNDFKRWAADKKTGISFEPTPSYTPQENGVIERYGGYVVPVARTMVIVANLPGNLWPCAIDGAVHIINRLVRTNQTRPPAEIWRTELGIPSSPVSIQHIRVWGCKAYLPNGGSKLKRCCHVQISVD